MVLGKLLDRTAVLFIGIAVGASIGQAFAQGGATPAGRAAPAAAVAAPVAAAQRRCPTDVRLSPRLVSAMRDGRPIHVGVYGDSFGEGLYVGLYNALRPQRDFSVLSFGKQATGFTRYRSVNLFNDIRERLAEQPVEIAVVSYGANDTFDIYEDGRLLRYMSNEWRSYISGKVRAYVAQLQQSGASVVWVGLPRMRDAAFDAKVQQMNAFYAGLMCDLNVPFIDTLAKSVDRNGAYTDYLSATRGGEPIKVRAPDGIHMSATGYRILIADMIDTIRQFAPPPGEAASRAQGASPPPGR